MPRSRSTTSSSGPEERGNVLGFQGGGQGIEGSASCRVHGQGAADSGVPWHGPGQRQRAYQSYATCSVPEVRQDAREVKEVQEGG
eukprot:7967686-Pyramimonas_sp.AAC.1